MKIEQFVLGDLRSNCYIIHKNKKAMIIDPGFESHDVVDFIKKEKLIPQIIYLTHGHFDHIGGVKQLKTLFNPYVYAPEKDRIWFENPQYNRLGYQIPVDEWVNEGKIIEVLDTLFHVIETPGHSEGGTVLYTDETLFSGDTLFYQSIGRTDIPRASGPDLYESIKKIYRLFPDCTVVYPGHGRSTTLDHEKKNNPFVREK